MFLLHRREAGSEETMEAEMVVGIIDWFLEEVSLCCLRVQGPCVRPLTGPGQAQRRSDCNNEGSQGS